MQVCRGRVVILVTSSPLRKLAGRRPPLPRHRRNDDRGPTTVRFDSLHTVAAYQAEKVLRQQQQRRITFSKTNTLKDTALFLSFASQSTVRTDTRINSDRPATYCISLTTFSRGKPLSVNRSRSGIIKPPRRRCLESHRPQSGGRPK